MNAINSSLNPPNIGSARALFPPFGKRGGQRPLREESFYKINSYLVSPAMYAAGRNMLSVI